MPLRATSNETMALTFASSSRASKMTILDVGIVFDCKYNV